MPNDAPHQSCDGVVLEERIPKAFFMDMNKEPLNAVERR